MQAEIMCPLQILRQSSLIRKSEKDFSCSSEKRNSERETGMVSDGYHPRFCGAMHPKENVGGSYFAK